MVTTSTAHSIYAQWKQRSVIVTFNANGGNVSTTSKEVKIGETYGTLPTPNRSNIGSKAYTYLGWYTASTGGTKITDSSSLVSNE